VSVRETLVRNTVWYGVVTVFGLAAGLVMSVVLARGLGPQQMGDFSYLLWVTRTVGGPGHPRLRPRHRHGVGAPPAPPCS
jgi:hypothetical protein